MFYDELVEFSFLQDVCDVRHHNEPQYTGDARGATHSHGDGGLAALIDTDLGAFEGRCAVGLY